MLVEIRRRLSARMWSPSPVAAVAPVAAMRPSELPFEAFEDEWDDSEVTPESVGAAIELRRLPCVYSALHVVSFSAAEGRPLRTGFCSAFADGSWRQFEPRS